MGYPDASRIGLITAIVFVGGFVGAFIASPTADYLGRRVGMLVGASLTFTGAVIQTAAQNSNMFIGGRFLIGLGINFTCVAGPSLLFELARPSMRGTISSLVLNLCPGLLALHYQMDSNLSLIVQRTLVCRVYHRRVDNLWNWLYAYQLVMANSVPHSGNPSPLSDHFCPCWAARVSSLALRKRPSGRGQGIACKISQQR